MQGGQQICVCQQGVVMYGARTIMVLWAAGEQVSASRSPVTRVVDAGRERGQTFVAMIQITGMLDNRHSLWLCMGM